MKHFIVQISLLLLTMTAVAAELGISPVTIHLSANAPRTTLNVVNRGKSTVTMQVDINHWESAEQLDSGKQTSDLMVNPGMFTLEPGQTQIIRVGLRRSPDASREAAFRLVLRQLPVMGGSSGSSSEGTGVRILTNIRMPVYVAPAIPVQKETWSARRDKQGNIVAQVRNHGNVHYTIGKVNLRPGTSKEGEPIASASVASVLFSGQEQRLELKASGPATQDQYMLEVFTDRGVQYVALNLAQD